MGYKNGAWTDFILDFVEFTDGVSSPDAFRLWSGISLVAGALERRVWVKSGRGVMFPHLYVLLMAPPGVGKKVIEIVRELWRETKEPGSTAQAFFVAPNNVSKASLLDKLAAARKVWMPRAGEKGEPQTYHSLLVAAEEFGVFLPAYEGEFMMTLNDLFNAPGQFSESRRHGPVRDLSIEHPQLNILGGYQPAVMGTTFPEEAWSSGFARRLIMVYSATAPHKPLFYEPELPEGAKQHLLDRLAQISCLQGPMLWRQEAATKLEEWDLAGGLPKPQHSKLQYYADAKNRTAMLLKLGTVSAVARTGKLILEVEDIERAQGWLFAAEKVMPDIFRAMIGRSDGQVLEELYYFVQAIWAKSKGKGVRGEDVWNFLAQRVPSEKVDRIVNLAERSNILSRQANEVDRWVPRPKYEHEVE